jgi:hypothetical protein
MGTFGSGPHWIHPFKVRRSNKSLTYAIRQNYNLLSFGGETCYLLQRKVRANAPFTVAERRISTITKVVSSYSTDPETGDIRAKLWGAYTDSIDEYPDIGVCTVTVQASGGASVYEAAVDKYSFIDNREEYAFDIYQDEIDTNGVAIEDSVYLVFNTPPYSFRNTAVLVFGTINPLVNFAGMQHVRDNQTGFQNSLFGFEQWLNVNSRIRTKRMPHAFLLAFPGVLSDFKLTDGGFLREQKGTFFTSPPPYSPTIYEHDVVIRASTSVRYQVTSYTPIMLESILCAQHMDLAELDPRSTIYDIAYSTE